MKGEVKMPLSEFNEIMKEIENLKSVFSVELNYYKDEIYLVLNTDRIEKIIDELDKTFMKKIDIKEIEEKLGKGNMNRMKNEDKKTRITLRRWETIPWEE